MSISGSSSSCRSASARTACHTPGPNSLRGNGRGQRAGRPRRVRTATAVLHRAASRVEGSVASALPHGHVDELLDSVELAPSIAFVVLQSDTLRRRTAGERLRLPVRAREAVRRPPAGCRACTRRGAAPGWRQPSPSGRPHCGRRRRTSRHVRTTSTSAPRTAPTMLRAASQMASQRNDPVDSYALWAASRRRSAAGDPSMNVTITAAAHNRSTRSGASAASNSSGSVSSMSAAALSSGTPLPTRTRAACASN